MPGLSEDLEEVDHSSIRNEVSEGDGSADNFVQQWTKIVLVLAITLATLNGVSVAPFL